MKLLIVGRRKPGTTLAEHRHHIRHVHGELVQKYRAADPIHAPKTYVQNQVVDGTFRATPNGEDPFALNRDFVTEIGFDSFADLGKSREQPFYIEHLQPDEGNFVDEATVVMLPANEVVMQAPNVTRSNSYKVFGFVAMNADQSREVFESAIAACHQKLKASSKTPETVGHIMNNIAAPRSVDMVDEFWFTDLASAQMFCRLWIDAFTVELSLQQQSTINTAHSFVLIAQEYLFD
jgi:EthD domain